jgi:hypothetical protein
VLLGTCDEDVGHPYRPFVEALRMELHHQAAAAVSITSRLLFGVSLD